MAVINDVGDCLSRHWTAFTAKQISGRLITHQWDLRCLPPWARKPPIQNCIPWCWWATALFQMTGTNFHHRPSRTESDVLVLNNRYTTGTFFLTAFNDIPEWRYEIFPRFGRWRLRFFVHRSGV